MIKLLKKAHRLRCARSPRSNVQYEYASARRISARLASATFLNSLQEKVFQNIRLETQEGD
jgi:hypothetical protein